MEVAMVLAVLRSR